jgi:hypothetical protein
VSVYRVSYIGYKAIGDVCEACIDYRLYQQSKTYKPALGPLYTLASIHSVSFKVGVKPKFVSEGALANWCMHADGLGRRLRIYV